MIDLHCHLLPAVDDGSTDLQTSITMSEQLEQFGYQAVCCTPHVPWSTARHTPQDLDQIRLGLQLELQQRGMKLKLYRGAEHHASELFERMMREQLILYPNQQSFLLEFPLLGMPARFEEILFRLQIKNLTPVIAHVERYHDVQQNVDILTSVRQQGGYCLVNLSSLAGSWGRQAEMSARKVIKAGLADAVTTDLHNVADFELIAEGLRILHKTVDKSTYHDLLNKTPAHIAGIDPGGDLGANGN